MNNNQRKTNYQEKYQREFPYQWFQYCIEPLEDIEGWDIMINDKSGQPWHMHHRDEIQSNGVVVSKGELMRIGKYYSIPANKLIFMTESVHMSLHKTGDKHYCWGKTLSDEHKKKISEAISGKNNPMHGKHHSEETKKKMSENHWLRGKPSPNRKPIEIDGVPYVSIRAAAKALEKHRKIIRKWLKSGKAKYL